MNEESKSARFAVGPAALLIVALVFFELTAFDLPRMPAPITAAAVRATATSESFLELASAPFRSRVLWAADAVLFLAAAAAAAVLAVALLRGLRTVRGRRTLVSLAAALFALELVAGLSGAAPAFRSMFAFTADALRAHGAPASRERVELLIQAALAVNVVVALVSALALVAGCTCAARPQAAASEALDECERQLRKLNTMLHLGSAMLATGVLHLYLWMRLPADLVGSADGTSAAITSFASTTALFWGAAYSAIVAAWYLPIARAIVANAREVAARDRDQVEVEELLHKRGLVESPLQRLPQFAAMLAPIVAGPLGGILSELVKAIG